MTEAELPPEVKPEGQQVEAIAKMKAWYKAARRSDQGVSQFFYLAGYAGTGKTTLAKFLLAEVGLTTYDVRMMTFMARSAFVLSRASGFPASTIHSGIYKLMFVNGREEWVLDSDSDVKDAKLIVLDECSMIGRKMFTDILSFRRPVLILGDPGQLLPINDDPFFQALSPDYFLTEIRRQALDNPIIRLSMMARQGQEIPTGNFGKAVKVEVNDLPVDIWKSADICLTFSNDKRRALNQTFRQVYGFAEQSPFPVKGDKLICLKNKHALSLTNGTLGLCTKDVEAPKYLSDFLVSLDFEPENGNGALENLNALSSYFVPRVNTVGMVIPDPDYAKKKFMHFDYAYCVTGHKALGSQFNSVIVIDDGNQRERNRWLYTAITRAIDTLYIVNT